MSCSTVSVYNVHSGFRLRSIVTAHMNVLPHKFSHKSRSQGVSGEHNHITTFMANLPPQMQGAPRGGPGRQRYPQTTSPRMKGFPVQTGGDLGCITGVVRLV